MVFPAESFDAQEVLRTVQEEGCTGLHGVPTMFISVLHRPDFSDYDVSTLRTGIMAGSPCPIEVMKRVTSQLNMSQVTIGYGMTETSPLSFQSATDTPLDKRVATVGRIHPHVEVKIVDVEGRITPRGQSGELCTRGYSVMPGYWGDPAKTAEAIDAAGWMRTGDLAEMDADGYVNIVGRVKDMVIRGGENIYPREVEVSLPPPQDSGRAGDRGAGRALRRGVVRVDPAARRRKRRCRRYPCFCQGRSRITRFRATSNSSIVSR